MVSYCLSTDCRLWQLRTFVQIFHHWSFKQITISKVFTSFEFPKGIFVPLTNFRERGVKLTLPLLVFSTHLNLIEHLMQLHDFSTMFLKLRLSMWPANLSPRHHWSSYFWITHAGNHPALIYHISVAFEPLIYALTFPVDLTDRFLYWLSTGADSHAEWFRGLRDNRSVFRAISSTSRWHRILPPPKACVPYRC